MDALNVALNLIKRGFLVFPLVNNKKIPATQNGCNDASSKEEDVRRWFGNAMFAGRNIGIKCENILVVDVDVKNSDGLLDLANMETALGSLSRKCVVRTQSGGFHYYFKRPEGDFLGQTGIEFNGKKTAIDIRVGNQYVVAPESMIDGKEYQWESGVPVSVDELDELPDAWKEFLPKKNKIKPVQTFIYERIPSSMNQPVRRCRAFMACKDPAIEGQHGQAQMWDAINDIFNGFALSKSEGWDILMEYNSRCCPPWDMNKPADAKWINYSVDKAIASPIDKGKLLREYNKQSVREVEVNEEFIQFEEKQDKEESKKIDLYDPLGTKGESKSIANLLSSEETAALEQKESERISSEFQKNFGNVYKCEEEVEGTLPYEILSVPGFINHCTEIIASRSPLYNHHCAFAASLSLLSAIIGEKIVFHGAYPNLYIITLAETGSGKDAGSKFIDGAYSFSLNNRGMENCFGTSVKSGEGIEEEIIQSGKKHYFIDEVSFLFDDMNKRGSGGTSVMDIMLRMYTASGTQWIRRTNVSSAKLDRSKKIVWNPFLTIIGTATPKEYLQTFSDRMIEGGLFGRLFIMRARKGIIQRGDEFNTLFRKEDYLRIDNFAKWAENYFPDSNNGSEMLLNDARRTSMLIPLSVKSTKEANDIINNFINIMYYKGLQKESSSTESALYARGAEKIYKLALLYEVSRKWERLTATMNESGKVDSEAVKNVLCIDKECVDWAYKFLVFVLINQLQDIERYRFTNEHDKELKSIKEIITKSCKSSSVGLCKRKTIYKKKSNLTKKQCDEIIDDLIAQGFVEEVKTNVKAKDGREFTYQGLILAEQKD